MTKITLVKGDIVKQKADAIVNAANKSLLGGGGVDGAIHQSAGPQLIEECRRLRGCATGQAKITKGYSLPAKHIIHAVGPIFGREGGKEAQLLADCYRNSLILAKRNNIKSIAFPAISTGVYGYPKEAAAKIAVKTVKKFIETDAWFDEIRFVVFSDESYFIYKQTLVDSKLI